MSKCVKVVERPDSISLQTKSNEKKNVLIFSYNFRNDEFSLERVPDYIKKELSFYKVKVIEGVAYFKVPRPSTAQAIDRYAKRFSKYADVIRNFETNEALVDYVEAFSIEPLREADIKLAEERIESMLYAFRGVRDYGVEGEITINFSSEPEKLLLLNLARTLSEINNNN